LISRLVGEQIERQDRRLIGNYVVLFEEHDWATAAVIQQLIVVELHQHREVIVGKNAVRYLADGAAGIAESAQTGDQRQAQRYLVGFNYEGIEVCWFNHDAILNSRSRSDVPTACRLRLLA